MRLEKVKDIQGCVVEVNLDCLSGIAENDVSNEVTLCFGGFFVPVDIAEYKRVKEMLEAQNVLCEVGKTDDPIKKFKEIVYKASYLDSDSKLHLIMQLENIE